MQNENETKPSGSTEYTPPAGSTTLHTHVTDDGRSLEYTAVAEWLVLRKKEEPIAEVFHVAYTVPTDEKNPRPITFVFNGGPGAASAYLHVGAVGPRRVVFDKKGDAPAPPSRLEDNPQSWLEFTDLVFVDPVGTGFSRTIKKKGGDGAEEKSAGKGEKDGENTEFFGLKRDLEALGEFMQKYLSKWHRWDSPVFVSGESYGGFRAAKLSRLLHEGYGIGLNGVVLISPALEFPLLDSSDYDVLPWIDTFPSMAAAAAFHGRSGVYDSHSPVADVAANAASFACTDMARALVSGNGMAERDLDRISKRAAKFLGIDAAVVQRAAGRVTPRVFARTLLADERRVCGLYDATITVSDPYPDRETYEGPDPTLYGIERVFTAGINTQLRRALKLETERDYHLLSLDVNRAWKIDHERHALESQIGATDDLRYGMTINRHMKVLIAHGYFDLETPFYSTERLVNHMKLSPELRSNLSTAYYGGGHMFYTWESSRAAFFARIKEFYAGSVQET